MTATFSIRDGARHRAFAVHTLIKMNHAATVTLFVLVATCTTFTLLYLFNREADMPLSMSLASLILPSLVAAQGSTPDLKWYAPKKSWINNLSQVLNGTGTNGFVFNGSNLPAGVQYGTYNWCNMPHVRKEEYKRPSDEFELVYVEV